MDAGDAAKIEELRRIGHVGRFRRGATADGQLPPRSPRS
jgi:hypothetical protein